MDWEKRKTMHLITTLIVMIICNEGYGQESVMSHLQYSSEINHRYAVTWVTAHMKNPSNSSKEVLFKMTLPKNAFISGLIMEVGGRNYTSYVEDNKAAKATYNRAKKRGNHAGLVEHSGTTEQKFQVSTNVEAQDKVIFYLKYEELLLRSKGKYTHTIQIQPGMKPSELDVTVRIKESEEIMGLEVVKTPLGSHKSNINNLKGSNSNATHIHKVGSNEAVVQYHSQGQEEGLYGELTLTYDVKRNMGGGVIQVSGDYFVHFFSPDGLPKMAAHTVFILDISGSMSGEKLRQLKKSMLKIFEDLKPEDSFELLTFHSDVKSLGVYSAGDPKDMENAIKDISNLQDQGSTDINAALIKGFENVLKRSELAANQVVFLTDGEPTSGVTTLSTILKNIININKQKLPLYSLAFGNDADLRFLNKISFHNRGFARQIPVDSNTDKILQGFYQEIGTPLLTDIDIQYPEEAVNQTSIVKKGWSTLQSGNEVIVAGQIKSGAIEIVPKVDGITKSGSHQFKETRVSNTTELTQKDNFIERLWAYLNIQDLINTAEQTDDAGKIEELKARARSLALKHSFVTKLTSLVVVRPEDLTAEDLKSEDLSIEENQNEDFLPEYNSPHIPFGYPSSFKKFSYSAQSAPVADSPADYYDDFAAPVDESPAYYYDDYVADYDPVVQNSPIIIRRQQAHSRPAYASPYGFPPPRPAFLGFPIHSSTRRSVLSTTTTSPSHLATDTSTTTSSNSRYSSSTTTPNTTQRSSSSPSITAQTKPKFCIWPYEEVGSQCLYVGEKAATRQDAQEMCQNLNGSLAEITQDQNTVIDFLESKVGPHGRAWLARTSVSNSANWLRSQTPVRGHWAWVELPYASFGGCVKLEVEHRGYTPHHCLSDDVHNYICEMSEIV